VCVSVSGTAKADSFTTRYGQATCQHTVDNSNGKRLEFFSEVDTETDDVVVGFKYVIEFQKRRPSYNRCDEAQRLAVRQIELDIQKKELELELLRRRSAEANESQGSRSEDKW